MTKYQRLSSPEAAPTSYMDYADPPPADQLTEHEQPTANQVTQHEQPTADQLTQHEQPTVDQLTQHEQPTADQLTQHEQPTANQLTQHEQPTADQVTQHEALTSDQLSAHEQQQASAAVVTLDAVGDTEPEEKTHPAFNISPETADHVTASSDSPQPEVQQSDVAAHAAVSSEAEFSTAAASTADENELVVSEEHDVISQQELQGSLIIEEDSQLQDVQ